MRLIIKTWHTCGIALKTCAHAKLRSLLSVLGVTFGIATLIATLSIGEGTKRQVLAAIKSMGSNLIAVTPRHILPTQQQRSAGLLISEISLFTPLGQWAKHMAPEATCPVALSYHNRTAYATMTGTHQHYAALRKYHIASGRFLSEKDIRDTAPVCVIGNELKQTLFPSQNPLGTIIHVQEHPLMIIGIFSEKKQVYGINFNTIAIIPLGLFQKLFPLQKNINSFLIEASDSDAVPFLARKTQEILLVNKKPSSSFNVWTQEALLEEKTRITKIFNRALGAIAAVSLFIGGIGIMNILLASVSERIREIGLRKAVGATDRSILLQFIIESLVLSGIGAVNGIWIGILLGKYSALILAQLLPLNQEWISIVTMKSILVALLSSLCIGFCFGIIPALKASRMDPVEALVHE